MALLLPGESSRPRLLEVVVAVAAVIGLCALGCASPSRTRRLYPSVFQAAKQEVRAAKARPGRPAPGGDEGAALVAATLRKTGLRFGTDGSTRALWGYVSHSHQVVRPRAARPGDLVFFDLRGRTADAPDCADHVGIVEKVEPSGRISFLEARGGQLRVSYVHPGQPLARRDQQGQVVNSFLRPKKIADPPDARYFAGEMLCGVARVKRR